MLRIILNRKFAFWLFLSIPALFMLRSYWAGATDAADMLHPTGEWSARLMILAMMLGPLTSLLGSKPWLNWLLQRRRALGVAAFIYALLHLAFYIIDMGYLADMVAELDAPAIWTGWLAMLAVTTPAIASNQIAVRLLRRYWKRVQQVAYAAALLTLAHWLLISYDRGPALIHFTPLIALQLSRLFLIKRK